MSRGRKVFLALFSISTAVAFGFGMPAFAQLVFEWNAKVTSPPGSPPIYTGAGSFSNIATGAILGLIFGGLIGSRLARLWEFFGTKWEAFDKGDKVNLVVGIFGGMIASSPIVTLLDPLKLEYHLLAVVGVWIGCVSATVYALHSMGDILPWAKETGPGKRRGIKILDTNILIDGRIYDIARTGFLDGQLYVPRFVLDELQYIADSHDALRRQRGRRGLDVLRMLQADYPTEVGTQDRIAPDIGDEVDSRLVRLARAMGADIVTNDFNLNRVASLLHVRVLNLNDLALAIRPNVLPSEGLSLTIVREGSQPGQGIGYMEDGTMVVIENGRNHVGQTVDVTVIQVIQTERGKMIFGEIQEEDPGAGSNSHSQGPEPKPRAARRRE
jgi:uncharacterized protein YacL